MSTKVKFKVSDKLVKARDGINYSLANYVEGVDYVMRGCFKGQKAVFRADILGASVVDPSLVEHKQEPLPAQVSVETTEKAVVHQSEPTPEDWRAGLSFREFLEAKGHVVRPATPFDPVQECKIMQVYPNYKWVMTDKGRVWVGLKGINMKRGQVIRVKGGELYLGKDAPSGSLVKL